MALAIVIVALVVVAGWVVWQDRWSVPPSIGPKSLDFAEARDLAASAVAQYDGGNWNVVYAAAVLTHTTVVRPFIGDNGPAACAYLPLSASQAVTIPATAGNFTSGISSYWAFLLRNSTTGIVGVSVADGAATVVGGGIPACFAEFAAYTPLPAAPAGSTQALASANQAGGLTFLHNHPEANLTLQLYGNLTIAGRTSDSYWYVSYSNCPVDVAGSGSINGPNATFTASLNASDAGLLRSENQTGFCPVPINPPVGGGTPLAALLGVGTTADSTGTDSQLLTCQYTPCHFYNATVVAAPVTGLWFGNLTLSDLFYPNGTEVSADFGVALVAPSGQVVGYAQPPTPYPWTPASANSILVDVGYQLAIFETSGPSLVGDYYFITGTPSLYTGSVEVTIS